MNDTIKTLNNNFRKTSQYGGVIPIAGNSGIYSISEKLVSMEAG